MRSTIISILALSILISCKGQTEKTERAGEPTIYNVEDDDKEMNDAVKKAKETLIDFDKAINEHNPNHLFFALKTRFTTPEGGEHIWVSGISKEKNEYFGVIDNLPEYTTEVKIGDKIKIDKDKISDWMYVDNNRLRGGFTIRILRNRMSEEERKVFDQENGLIIEE